MPKTPSTQPMLYLRNDQVGAAMASEVKGTPSNPWPPVGSQVVGYVTAPIDESPSPLQEWTVDADFGLAPGAGGSASGAPYPVKIASGWRAISAPDGLFKERPLNCNEFSDPPKNALNKCFLNEGLTVGVSDLG